MGKGFLPTGGYTVVEVENKIFGKGMDEVKGWLLALLLAQQCWSSSSPLFVDRPCGC